MKRFDLDGLLSKVNRINGNEVFDEILTILYEVRPVLENMSNTIEENSYKLPIAAKKLSYVTESTEKATSEILQVVENMFKKVSRAITYTDDSFDYNSKLDDIKLYFLKLQASNPHDPELKDNIFKLDSLIEKNNTQTQNLQDLNIIISTFFEDLTSIMIQLEVQDITAQHIASVYAVLNSLQIRLSHMIDEYKNSDLSDLIKDSTLYSNLHRKVAYHDDDETKALNQSYVDHIFNNDADDNTDYNKEIEELLIKSQQELGL